MKRSAKNIAQLTQYCNLRLKNIGERGYTDGAWPRLVPPIPINANYKHVKHKHLIAALGEEVQIAEIDRLCREFDNYAGKQEETQKWYIEENVARRYHASFMRFVGSEIQTPRARTDFEE